MDYKKRIGSVISISMLFFTLLMTAPTLAAEANVPEQDDIANMDENEKAPIVITDPYEHFNRGIFTFNDKFDTYLFRPAAELYNTVMPGPLNLGIHNFFNNINTVPTIINDLLQMHIYQAANDFWRVLINTTIGIGGLFDVATRLGLPPYSNDFGLTLATWGYRNSNFFVIPLFGPSTIRDGIEIPVDYYLFSIYPYIKPDSVRYGIWGLSVIDRRAQLAKFQSLFEEVAIDKYAFQRNAYMQRRQFQIEENNRLGVGVKERAPRINIEENRPSNTNIGID
jgi:phospholipid-binding lipoprotein MlaA